MLAATLEMKEEIKKKKVIFEAKFAMNYAYFEINFQTKLPCAVCVIDTFATSNSKYHAKNRKRKKNTRNIINTAAIMFECASLLRIFFFLSFILLCSHSILGLRVEAKSLCDRNIFLFAVVITFIVK